MSCIIFLILSGIFTEGFSQEQSRKRKILPAITPAGVPADMVDFRYGDHKKNVFDLWQAKTDRPSPLVIYIHGGGFRGGDKSKIYNQHQIDHFLNNGISFASINYRPMTGEALGVRASLSDSKRALQYLRNRAQEWHIDGNRIACFGGSAGAGTSLWLAFHDEMAEPENIDPVLRESTRIQVAGAIGTQATYNFNRWIDILELEAVSEDSSEVWRFYGLNSAEDLHTPEGQAVIADLDMLGLMDSSDPPFYVVNNQPGGLPPESRGHMNHHPLHAKALKDRAEEVGVEAIVYAPRIGIEPPTDKNESLEEFLVRILKRD